MGRIEDRDELMIGGKEKERRVTIKVGRRMREGLIYKWDGEGEKGFYKGGKEKERRVTIKVRKKRREGLL